MQALTLDGLKHHAWVYEPDWSARARTRFAVEAEQVAGLTVREGRRALGTSLRTEIEARYLLEVAGVAEIRNALRSFQGGAVRLPFWPAIDEDEAARHWSTKWWMAYNEGSGAGAVADVAWTEDEADYEGEHLVPTLLGYLVDAPQFRLVTPELVEVGLRWREGSPFEERLRLAEVAWTPGPQIGARTIYRFPFLPDFVEADSGGVVVEVTRKDIGFGRESASEVYPQVGRREPAFSYQLNGADAAALVRFFQDRKGPVEPFWLPSWLSECRLVQDIEGGEVEIEVTDAAALGAHRYVAFFDGELVLRKVTGIAGNVLTLEAGAGRGFKAHETVLCTLVLARFASAELTVDWSTPDWARCLVQFQEVAQEYATPAGEVYAETLGPLAERCWLYELRHGAEVWRWTSYEKPLTADGNVFYETRPVEHGDFQDGLAWEVNKCSVTCRSWDGNPFHRAIYGTLTERMELVISRGVPGEPVGAVEVVFRGWVTSASFRGPWITTEVESFGGLFARRIPRTLLQPTDNFALFDSGNRLVRADWTFTARLTAAAGAVLTFDNLAWPQGALPEISAEYFALGYVDRPDGDSFERIPVASSSALAAGAVQLTLVRQLIKGVPEMPENGWSLVPGYDGLLDTAVSKFGNPANFGGFNFLPASNPSLIAVQKGSGGNSKK